MQTAHRATLEPDRHKRQHLLHEIFDGFNASSDWPGHAFVDDLVNMYPGAKIVLNKRRTPQEWERSVRSSLAFFSTWTYLILTCWIPICYCHHRMYRDYMQLARRRYGVNDIFAAECYERHNEWVRKVASSRGKEVLEWEPDDGWEPLCKFLGYEIPTQPFPVTNDTTEIEQLKVVLIKRGLLAWAGVVGFVAVAAIAGLYLAQQRQSD